MVEISAKKTPYRVIPYHLEIRSLHDDRMEIVSPISVLIEEEDEHVIAYAPDLDIYGCGYDLGESLEDLRGSIVEMYYDLEKEKDKLGVDLKKIWDYLHSIMRLKCQSEKP